VTARRIEVLWPDREDICTDPPLAILAALDATLSLAVLSLGANHPSLGDCERPYYLPPLSASDKIAEKLVSIGRTFQHALAAYRKAILEENEAEQAHLDHSDEIPF
jgi:hypothetical protein